VDRHPDSDTLLAFREHRISGPAVADVALHIERCAECATAGLSAAKTALQAFVSSNGHLSDDEIDVLIDQRGHHPHLDECAMCRAEVEDLRRFDAGSEPIPFPKRTARRWLIAAAIAFAVLGLSAIAFFVRRTTPDANPVIASKPASVTSPAPAAVASLADGAGKIALLEDGTIAGVTLRSPRDGDDARAVLSGHSIPIPTFIAAMPGAVRGGIASAHPLRAIEPFRSAVIEPRPRFSWTAIPGAQNYRVEIFDSAYEEITRSEPLHGTSWTPSKPLPAGIDLSWHVVAGTGSTEMSSAGSDRAEAVFRVLTPEESAEVETSAAHYQGSHLFRGLLYSRHGLLHDAEREYRLLAEQNPDSPVARKLIASVSR
jgi:hypothetical protein